MNAARWTHLCGTGVYMCTCINQARRQGATQYTTVFTSGVSPCHDTHVLVGCAGAPCEALPAACEYNVVFTYTTALAVVRVVIRCAACARLLVPFL